MNKSFLSEDDKLKIIELRKNGYTILKISQTINKRFEPIASFLKEKNIEKPLLKSIELNQDEINDIIFMYENNETIHDIIEKYKPKINSYKSINKILKANNIELKGRSRVSKLNHHFFTKIDSEEKAYILGFLLSDGYVVYQKKRSPKIGIQLHIKDKYIIEKIKEIWNAENVQVLIKDESFGGFLNGNPVRKGKSAVLNVQSKQMANDLKKYSITPKKSFTSELKLDIIPKEYHHHFIRGIFDGDGTIYCRNAKYNYYNFGFYGNEKIITQLSDYLVENLEIAKIKISKRDTVYYFQNGKVEDVLKFHDFIYKDATFFLKRKKQKFNEFIRKNKCKFKC